ncbi:dormancy-associated protein homolog 4 isoform X2 [Ricinus communis]|uniref:dormancy-associated protein homolog 4 isoform X2 n=1 Tax=Ricinus communis TaxID=3988 RepID=UPI00201A3D2D|nr:dormancy-associated protein homolog 4 isoform X2 [Ricinus communis]
MEFLHKLWDETLAGPAPETGVGKLRKYDSFSASRSSPPVVEEMPIITRSITILKSNSNFKNLSIDPGSAPDSPASSTCTTPRTPFSPGTPSGELRKWTRRKSSADALQDSEPRSPTVYDWIVISALDR